MKTQTKIFAFTCIMIVFSFDNGGANTKVYHKPTIEETIDSIKFYRNETLLNFNALEAAVKKDSLLINKLKKDTTQ